MRDLDLSEYQRSEPRRLSAAQRAALRDAKLSLTIEPADGEGAGYHLTPGATVGAVELDGLSVLIQPKVGIPQLLSLAAYAMGAFTRRERQAFDFQEDHALPDTLALALAAAARQAFARGLLHGYLTRDDALPTVRGRIRFDDQLRRRFDLPLPVEVRYDEFTDDILANQLIKAAAARLAAMRLRSRQARQHLGRVAGTLDNVSLVDFPPRRVPEVAFDRLNQHYRRAVGLSRLILRHSAFESARGTVRAAGFLIDMNQLFQEFVTQALRESLHLSKLALRSDADVSGVRLDTEGRVRLEPDLSWWDGPVCTFVGDVKYKNLSRDDKYKNVTGGNVPNADLYQLLAYATALDLPGGLLIYAKGEAQAAVYEVQYCGIRLHVAALDLAAPFDQVLADVDALAARVRALRGEARGLRRAA